MENKKKRVVSVFAVLAVFALLLAGAGYAYTSTTVSTNNSVNTEDIAIKVYKDVAATDADELYDYSATDLTKSIKYSVYKADVNDEKYAIAEDSTISSIAAIKLVSTGAVTPVKVIKMQIGDGSATLFTGNGYEYSMVKATLTNAADDTKVWEGTTTDGIIWTFQSDDDFETSLDGVVYKFSLMIEKTETTDKIILTEAEVEQYFPFDAKLSFDSGFKIAFKADTSEPQDP